MQHYRSVALTYRSQYVIIIISCQALGSICIRHYDLMMDDRLKQRYISILTSHQHATHHKIQVKALHFCKF